MGAMLIEGKTKQVFDVEGEQGLCMLINKDRITAGDGVKAHDLQGKAAISNQTNAKVFHILNGAGVKTSFVKMVGEKAFLSKKCAMVPIEWVTRRLATGSFLKRNTGVPEGYRFYPPKQETFYKDDANHDPQWSSEQIISAKFHYNGVNIGADEVELMGRTSVLVFEILERAWANRECALIDMKIEFGVDVEGNILVADVIDSDSWRLWPSGDKRLMVDKQVYRNLTTVTSSDLDTVKRNFAWVSEQLEHLLPVNKHLVAVLMGSPSDKEHCQKIANYCKDLGLNVEVRVTSAHKGTERTLSILAELESRGGALVIIAVAGRSNGLGPVLAANASCPVINCPPPSNNMVQDIWSSLSIPSGMGCSTTVGPECAAISAAQVIAQHDVLLWGRLRAKKLQHIVSLYDADKKILGTQ